MKKPFFVILLICLTLCTFSQSAELTVVASSGININNNDVIAEWTVGEPFIIQLADDTHILAQGFHQSETNQTITGINSSFPYEVAVYPNPILNDKLNISILNAPSDFKWNCEIFDIQGNLLMLKSQNDAPQVDLSKFSNSVYIIKISDSEGNSKTIPITKQ